MKPKEFLLGILTGAVLLALFELNARSHKIKNLEFQHSRDSLVSLKKDALADSLRGENQDYKAQIGWYESELSKETGD